MKDLGITKEFMQSSQFKTDLPDLIHKYLSDALEGVDATADHTECLVGWEKRSGVQLKKTKTVQDIPKEDFEHRLKGLNRP